VVVPGWLKATSGVTTAKKQNMTAIHNFCIVCSLSLIGHAYTESYFLSPQLPVYA
jgi:hypothetical protein